MSMNAAQENAPTTVSEKMNAFLSRNKILLLIIISLILVFFIGLGVYTAVKENTAANAYSHLEEAESMLEKAKEGTDSNAISAAEDEVLKSLEKFTKQGNPSFVKTRAYMLIAEVYYSRKDWNSSKTAYLKAFETSPKMYTSGITIFNAAVCAEEAGNYDEAIELFKKAIDTADFSQSSRTLFNIARIQENQGKSEDALKTYESLISTYPDDEWSLLAKSRKIALSN